MNALLFACFVVGQRPFRRRAKPLGHPANRPVKNDHIASLVGEMGNMSDSGGQFFGLHMIAVDSDGNIYTGEVQQGERVQRFVPGDSPRGELLQQLASTPVTR